MTDAISAASRQVNAMTVTQSIDWQAGTSPAALIRPRVGLCPTMLLNIAGTRPLPAVSVATATGTMFVATATADPLLDPPEIRSRPNTLRHAPYGDRTPTRPVANWSRFVLPTTIAPASVRRCTAKADRSGVYANA